MSRPAGALAVLFLTSAACAGESGPSGPAGDLPGDDSGESLASDVAVEAPAVMMWDAGATMSLTVRILGADGRPLEDADHQWFSKNPAVATVAGGVVTAVGDGWTEVGASAGEHAAAVSVVVITQVGPTDRTDCIACHADAYVARHGGSGVPETCLECHHGPTWTGGSFDHSAATGFALLGAHASLPCAACHGPDGTPIYPGVADDECIACHQADYDRQHADSSYPPTCLVCHTTDTWLGAEFDHDSQYFPIYGGRHPGRWQECGTCHIDRSDYSVFSCFGCHPHDRQRMDDRHADVPGYVYDSEWCYACHPRGEAD